MGAVDPMRLALKLYQRCNNLSTGYRPTERHWCWCDLQISWMEWNESSFLSRLPPMGVTHPTLRPIKERRDWSFTSWFHGTTRFLRMFLKVFLCNPYSFVSIQFGMYDDIAEETGMAKQTLKDTKWVSENVESSLRKDNLSFNHHKEVASLPRLSEWIRQL